MRLYGDGLGDERELGACGGAEAARSVERRGGPHRGEAGGVAFFGASYLTAAFFGVAYEDCFGATWAYAGCKPPFRRLLIPLVGPLTYVGDDSTHGAFQALFVGDAVLQIGGLAVAVAGAVMRTPGVQPSARTLRPVVGLKSVGIAGTF